MTCDRSAGALPSLDESTYSRVLAFAMQAAGANVRRVGSDIPHGSTDKVWLEIVGKNNWIALMRDQRIRRRRLEIEALKVHGVAEFAFTGQETAQQTAQTILSSAHQVRQHARKRTKALPAHVRRVRFIVQSEALRAAEITDVLNH